MRSMKSNENTAAAFMAWTCAIPTRARALDESWIRHPCSARCQSGASAVARRPGARRMLEDCWTPIRNAVELRFGDILLETLGPLAKSDDEDEARPAKHILLRDKAALQAFSEALHAEFKQAVADFCAHRAPDKASAAPG